MGEKETMTAGDTAARSGTLNVSATPGGSASANLADDGNEAARSGTLTVSGTPGGSATGNLGASGPLTSRPTGEVTIPLRSE